MCHKASVHVLLKFYEFLVPASLLTAYQKIVGKGANGNNMIVGLCESQKDED